ncbi:transglutaminase domain-containing protein [Chloroflexota bacterium]
MLAKYFAENAVPPLKPRIGRMFRRWFILIVLLWVLLVLYPNPAKLVISIKRVFYPEVDAVSVEQLASELPDNPADIEREVLERIPYSYDWEVSDMPWYFPAANEIMENGRGDCKARALILASVLEAKGVPYSINLSPTHMWVDYEGKIETSIENSQVQYFQRDPQTGERSFQFPKISFSEILWVLREGFWSPMPLLRKLLLLLGLISLFVLRFTWFRKKKALNIESAVIDNSGEIRST